MKFRALSSRLVVMPIVALFLLLGGGATLAKTCHIDLAAAVQTHIHQTHDHPNHSNNVNYVAKNLDSKPQDLSFQVCFLIGFVALLIIRFFNLRRNFLSFKFLDFAGYKVIYQRSQILSYLSPTHLKLNIIRI